MLDRLEYLVKHQVEKKLSDYDLLKQEVKENREILMAFLRTHLRNTEDIKKLKKRLNNHIKHHDETSEFNHGND